MLTGYTASAQVVIKGSVYGGGMEGQVKNPKVESNIFGNSSVTINDGTIESSVYGGGKGVETNETSGLVEGNTTVTMTGGMVERSIYGGGSLGSVGTFSYDSTVHYTEGQHAGLSVPFPTACATGTGLSTVTVTGGNVGRRGSLMPWDDHNPDDDDRGWIFCGSRGEADSITYPRVIAMGVVNATHLEINKTETTVPLITASVYGGCENGLVLDSTFVKIMGGQIGTGCIEKYMSGGVLVGTFAEPYTDQNWSDAINAVKNGTIASALAEGGALHDTFYTCDAWDYGVDDDDDPTTPKRYDVYDIFYDSLTDPNDPNSHYRPDNTDTIGSNGQTYFGNVFGGGSGYYPIAPGVWRRTAGRVNGNTRVEITGGHILTSVYGGNEVTDVMGRTTIKMSGGTIGVPRSNADIQDHPILCNLFGSGKGDQRVWANKWTNVDSTIVEFTGGTIFGSIFGGGEDGHVLGSTYVTVNGDNALIGTLGYSGFEGHVYGSGRGFSGVALTAGNVGGNTNITIESGTILGSIYGGGRNASVGPKLWNPEDLLYGQMQPDDNVGTHGHTHVTINGGVIGNDYESKLHRIDNNQGGNVYGGSMGTFTLLDGSLNPMWPRMSKVKTTNVTIDGENTIIKGNVFGGCKLGTVVENTSVTIKKGTIWRSVYGSGYGSDNNTYVADNVVIIETPDVHDSTYQVTPRRHAGRVYGNTKVSIEGGWVKKNVYGGGNMASTGTITNEIVVQSEIDSLSIGWPVRLTYKPDTGADTVLITGGRIGITGNDFMGPWNTSNQPYDTTTGNLLTEEQINAAREVNGQVFGGGRGSVGNRREMAELADYVKTVVTVNYASTASESGFKPNASVSTFYSKYSEWTDYGSIGCIVSNLYGASENGHVHDSTYVTLTNGLIGGSLFGGGKGTDMYLDDLWVEDNSAQGYHIKEDTLVHSVTAGKVFGKTYVTMDGGHVLGNVYGGGEFASVGKGNYLGYGEHSTAEDSTNMVLKSGQCYVAINGGTVGTATWNHNGNVFGSSKGLTYKNVTATPRYNYSRDFFLGYTNFAYVTIGKADGATPRIYGSVFGGGENGHVRFNTEVTINKGEIGVAYNSDLSEEERTHRGNIYGAGQGIDKIAGTDDYCNSAGSVTLNTKVTVNGGTIHRNVYGGGSLASVGPPPTGYNPGTSLNEVIIKGGTIGEVVTTVTEGVTTYSNYGGDVFGAGRGIIDEHAPFASFATSNNTKVTLDSVMQGSTPVSSAFVIGNVYGGGELGQVKHTTQVDMKAGYVGTIGYTRKHGTDPSAKLDSVYHKTGGHVFGGGRGDLTDPVTNREAALVTDTTHVTISGGHVQYSVYGGGEVASVGLREQHDYKYNEVSYTDYLPKQSKAHADSTGVTMVTILGGQVGPAPKVDATHNVEIGLNGVDGYVFGGGKGIGEDPIPNPTTHPYSGGSYYAIADVNNTYVTVDMPMPVNATDTTNRIWGSTFGGAEDGHVLGSARTYYKNGLMGTTGTTTYDGNIFGGGRNYSKKNYNAGRVRVNDSIDMCGGQIYGSIFGGGRLALTGIDLYGNMIPDTSDVKHGNTFVKVSGGIVGNDTRIEEWIASSMGDVYGAGKGDTIGVYGHPKASALLVSLVKNTEVLITDTVIGGVRKSPRILGSVFGGGEVANVGHFTWNIGSYSGVLNIGDIQQLAGTGKTKVTVRGGVIGADKAQMRVEMAAGTGNYNLKYNDDRGHVFGGGEGWVDDPTKYAVINPSSSTPGIHNNKRLIDLMAVVGETEVTISDTAFVKGSVYGGAMSGHVLRDTKVTVSGGQIGAGYDKENDLEKSRYKDKKFFNPVGYFARHTTDTDIHADSALFNCYRWDYVAENQRPFDPIALKSDPVANKPTNGETWFGHVFGGGSGYYPYIVRNQANTADSCVWNPDAGKVFGHTEVEITGGHILSNVYGGNQTTDVGNYVENGTTHQLENNSDIAQAAKTIVTMSGGTVGVPRIIDSIQAYPFTSSVYGGGQGNFADHLKALNNVDSTRVVISDDALVYGSVFGGSQNAHVLDSAKVLINGGVIGTTGLSGYDGHVFGGGQGTVYINPHYADDTLYAHAGRVGGNTRILMSGGKVLGNLYGGGMVALTGVDLNGWFDAYTDGSVVYDSTNHGMAKVELSGGFVGNDFNHGRNILTSSYPSGNVYGGGRGKLNEYHQDDLGRLANSAVEISGSPTVYGSVFGGGEMANVGYWRGYDLGWYATKTAATRVTITGSPTIGTELEFKDQQDVATYAHNPGNWTRYDTIRFVKYGETTNDTTYLRMLAHTRTGNVYGGGQGDVRIVGASHNVMGLEQGHCANTKVNIGGTPTIRGSVFGGSEEGVVWGETEVHIAGGTIGTTGIVPDSLKYNHATQHWDGPLETNATYYYGSVFGGSYGKDYYSSFNIASPRQTMIDSVNILSGRVYGNTLVDITGGTIRGNVFGGGNMASVGIWNKESNDLIPIADPVRTTYRGNATVTVNGSSTVIGPLDGTGLNAYVFGGGKGFANDPTGLRKEYANVDSTFVTVSGGKILGSVFGGGSDSHVLGSTSVTVHSGANIGTDGLSTWDGNIFGGGRNFQNTNHTNGRVAGNIDINMDGGTLQGSIFGGGRLALTGVNVDGNFLATNWDVTKHGNVNIEVSGDATTVGDVTIYSTVIGNDSDQGIHLLTGSDESVGDIFGSGKGDTKAYMDTLGGRVTNATISIIGSPRIHGAVFGGGEMASLGWWGNDHQFIANTGEATITIGRVGQNDNPVIGTYLELDSDYLNDEFEVNGQQYDHSDWTMIETVDDAKRVYHTCTGNVFGGCQGDVDFEDWETEPNHWPYMGRSKTATITVNGGTIIGGVFGGPEQGTMDGNATITINDGNIGSVVTDSNNKDYNFGGVYGAGYGSDDIEEDNLNVTVYGTTLKAKERAGRVYGNTLVNVLGGLIKGDVFGGASFAYVGGEGENPNGNVQVNIGKEDEEGQPIVGSATILGSVFGANNRSGTPLGYVNVDVYHTAHRTWEEDDVLYTNYAPILTDTVWSSAMLDANINGTGYFHSIGKQCYAIKEVFAGGNHASYTPNETRGVRDATVHVHYCENTIEDLYGGSNAADIGTSDVHANDSVIVDGGRFYRVFGGGNGTTTFANVHGTATTRINAGVIQEVYGGGNHNGIIDNIDLEITHANAGTAPGNCDDFIYDVFGGNNEAEVIGDIVSVINCGDGYQYEFYGGNNTATVYGDVTTNVFGGETAYLFGGSKGSSTTAAHIRQFPSYDEITADLAAHPSGADTLNRKYSYNLRKHMRYDPSDESTFRTDLVHTKGNVTLNIFGGTISQAAFGGSDENGTIDGKITVNVFDAQTSCNLDLNNLYGAGRNTDYVPIYTPETGTERISPVVNVIHGTVQGSVYGGGMGASATVEASPVVNIGYASVLADTVSMLRDTIRHHYNTWELPSVYADTVKGNVYGGGELAQVEGNTNVNMYAGVVGDSIGRIKSQVNPALDSVFYGLYAYELKGGRVFGGGEGSEELKTHGLVTGNATVTMSGGKVYKNVYGGGELSSVGTFTYDAQATDSVVAVASGTGLATVTIKGGEIGPLDGSGQNAYVFGGSRGKVILNGPNPFVNFANVGSAVVTVCDSARIYGSIFGGAEDGHVLGDVHVYVQGSTKDTIPVIGTNAKTSWDGNLFGGGRNYMYVNNTAGRVAGNIQVDMSDGKLLGNLYGGGRLGLTGMNANGQPIDGEGHGYITVNVSGGTIGRDIDTVTIGNVFGGGKGIYEDPNNPYGATPEHSPTLGRVKQTNVTISNNARIHGSVYGGGEIAKTMSNTNVTVSGGIIGSEVPIGGSSSGTRYNGSVFGGGKGYDGIWAYYGIASPGETFGDTYVTMTGGQVMENVYGGAEVAEVGTYVYDSYDYLTDYTANGHTHVTIKGGEIGPLDGTGNNGFVYGGGQGIGDDSSNSYKYLNHVGSTSVVVSDSAVVHASVFGGGAFGHVWGNTSVLVEKGLNTRDTIPLIGTDGMHGYDGNIFGGGQGDGTNYANGRVGGNTTVEMTHGTVYGNIYGGGRLALTGVDMDGSMQSGTDHGNTKVMVKGGTVGNASEIVEFTDFSMGNIYGGGKGYLDIENTTTNDAESVLLLGLTKNTTIEVSDTLGNNTHVYGIILGGGEIANVGKYTLTKSGSTITNIAVTEGATNVRVGGGIIGGDRAQMRYELAEPGNASNWYSKYNDDLGYVYGGGEGWSDDPDAYPQIYADGTSNPQTSLLDLVATVQSTNVTITNDTIKTAGPNSGTPHKPWVKASVFGGSESGHVRGNTKVTIAGGLIGAGDSGSADVRYDDNDFINPVTTEVTTSPNNTLKGTANWHYEAPYNPYDPAKIRNQYDAGTGYGYVPCDGKSWFGNVFGGGSGWFPYVTGTAGNFVSHWNPKSGKVWGNTEVIITGGHILNNVYGGNEMTDVGGKATVKMSGGTVGVPRTAAQVALQPVTCYVFGGGCGDPRDIFYDKTNVAETDVQITGGTIYGSVFGGAEDGHVLGDAKVTVSQPSGKTTVIGSTGKSGADGNIFGGGRNFLHENYTAGRVEGNIDVTMTGGTLLGNVYGGGRMGITGVDANGANITANPADHGNVTIDIQGGTVGNARYLNLTNTPDLYTNDAHKDTLVYTGHVFGGGKGIEVSGIDAYKLARVKNTEVKISETDATNNPTRILGNVYGGGELANVGWVTEPGTNYVATTGGLAKVDISGGRVGWEQIGQPQASIVGGNVYGGGLGLAGGNDVLPFANVDTTRVEISSSAYVIGSVFGGADNGHVWRNTSINMTGGTVGQRNTLAELTVDVNEQPTTDHIYTGSVLAGGRGVTPEATSPAIVYNDTTGIVFGNATVSITGGAVRHAVYGGGGLSHVGTFERNASTNEITFTSGGKCTVSVAGTAHIGPTKEDLDALAGDDNAKKNTFFNMLGGNAGWVFGAGCGLAGHPDLTFCDSTLVTISGSAQVTGAAFGGGENGHVLDSTHIVINGGTIGGIPLHGTGSVSGTGSFAGIDFTATTDECHEDEFGAGPRVLRGFVYGGGKGNDYVSTGVYDPYAGQVYGNAKVEITNGTIYSRVFGGGLLSSVGTFNYAASNTDSIVGVVDNTGLAKVIVSGGTIGTDGNNNGDVFGGGRGKVGRHWEPTYTTGDQVVNLAYVGNTEVTIKGTAQVKSNVYGGSGSGHVQEDAHVIIEGGTIGISGHGGWHSNVYGGGGGQHQYQRTPTTTHHSITSGRVFGNTTVEIKGGTIYHNVYGGGAIASVGTYNIYDLNNLIEEGTGNTEVTITGGTIGVDGDNNGMVFGSGRGQIAPIGAFMDSLSYAVNTVVNIGTEGSSDGPMVHGSVYGSGENGHVFQKATVNVYSGTIGCENYDPAHASFFANHGNVYGAGCGTDMYDSDGNGSEDSYNPRSGIVQGNTEVNIKGGHISHCVYGGGAMALVGTYTPYGLTGDWGGDITGTVANTGKAVVNITGGTIGTASTTGHVVPDNVEHGNVYGGSRGPNSGDGFTNYALTDTSFVFISGDDTHVLGNVFGGGSKSLVRTARVATISGGTIGTDGLPNSSGVYNGYVFGGSQHGLDDIDSNPYTSLKTVNVRGGHIMGNVFGCSDDAVEGITTSSVYNPVWTSFVNITGGTIEKNVYGAGKAGRVNGSVCVNIGANAVKKAPTNTPSDENANVFMTVAESGSVEPVADTLLVINGSVYGGSHGGASGWKQFDISQYAVVYIDGKGYDTRSETIPTVQTSDGPYMNIGGSLYGSGTTCESGALGRQIVLKNYGHRNNGDEFTSATRSLTTIQRCGHVLLDSTNVKLNGDYDITLATTPTEHDRKYGVMKVDTAMYVYDGSGIVLGAAHNPVYMDSIRVLKSVLLAEGTIYDSALLYKLRWDTIGIMNNDNKLHRIHNGSATGVLASNYENVIIFNDTSRLWVRYTDKKPGDAKDTTYYGELQGFFRMRADSYEPRGSESFAYARPKITDGSGNDNISDGGFLSYQNTYNYFVDNGAPFTKTKQYPYVNVLGGTRADRTEYRLWAYPNRGNVWYVDGRPTGSGQPGWGNDEMNKKEHQAGLYPDKPKKTLFAANKGVVTETYTGADAIYNYSYKKDQIYVVGALSEFDGAVLRDSIGAAPARKRFPLRLYRYPGGHAMSNGETDEGNGTATPTWGVTGSNTNGPGANYGAMLDVATNTSIQLKGVVMDGLSAYTLDDENDHMIPASFDTTKVTMPLVITHSGSTLTLQDSTVLQRGYNGNSTDATAWFDNSAYDTPADTYHGGALFVDAAATVNVSDTVFITGNKQKKGEGYVESNVFIPTFAKYLNVTDTLSAITRIGVTKPRRNDRNVDESDYTYNTFSPVAVVATSEHAADTARNVWRHNNFYDDMDMFFVNGYTNENQRSTYYSASIPDYPSSSTGLNPDKTLFFGWTWNNVVRTAPTDFAVANIDSKEDLAWLASVVNGLNGQSGTSLSGTSVLLKDDIDMKQYVWVPVGQGEKPFSGTFDGQGHLIKNLSVDYIGTGDRRYGYDDYGLFGKVSGAGSTVNRTFVVSGIVRPEGNANIGGLVGLLDGGTLKNSEAADSIVCPDQSGSLYAGGLVGRAANGAEIHSSMAMPSITVVGQYGYIGGLLGGVSEGSASLINAFANAKFTLGDNITGAGGLAGHGSNLTMKNCYINLFHKGNLESDNRRFGLLLAYCDASTTLAQCFYFGSSVLDKNYNIAFDGLGNPDMSDCVVFRPVTDADNYGYMYSDNTVDLSGVKKAMFKVLNDYIITGLSDATDKKYARWARPTLGGINGDLPVLLLENYDGSGQIGAGDFRSVASIAGSHALQYGGTVRDGNSHELSTMLGRAEEVFVYGDVKEDLADDDVIVNATKVAIHEDAAILKPGKLSSYGNNYVGVTFDNSSRHAVDAYGNILGRDWHMFSTPLANAPLGINYNGENIASGPQYNPWDGDDTDLPEYEFYSATDHDGYFPSNVPAGYVKPTGELYDYPYDFRTWFEPDWQWINFKRNGPSHWHYDEKPGTTEHLHIDYKAHYGSDPTDPSDDAPENVNEENFVVGKGYMMAIQEDTYLQSHGNLSSGNKSFTITNSYGSASWTWVPEAYGYFGNNLVGNPYHAYLNFDKFGETNGYSTYYIYSADDPTSTAKDEDYSGYMFYVKGGSRNGFYAPQYIHPHQGFFVQTDEDKAVSFKDTDDDPTKIQITTRAVAGTSPFRDRPNYKLVNLFAYDQEGLGDVVVIEFERPEFGGGPKIKTLRNGNHLIYAHHDTTDYGAFFAKQELRRIPVRFKSFEEENTLYTLKWDLQNGYFPTLYLVDNMTGTIYDMTRNDTYLFSASKEDYLSRFYIVFDYNDVEEFEETNTFAFFNGSAWVVNGKGYVELFDVTGRCLYTNTLSGDQSDLYFDKLAKGVYMLRLSDGFTVRTQKIVIQ